PSALWPALALVSWRQPTKMIRHTTASICTWSRLSILCFVKYLYYILDNCLVSLDQTYRSGGDFIGYYFNISLLFLLVFAINVASHFPQRFHGHGKSMQLKRSKIMEVLNNAAPVTRIIRT